jgi:hypothetical protein
MRQKQMEVGEVYVMQRGPTRRALTVTLLDLTTPSGVRGRVMVKVEDGVGRGREIEAPSSSLYPLHEEPEEVEVAYKPTESRHEPAPAGWLPTCGESVTWSKTGGVIFQVKQLTREGALISGELLGMEKEYRVPFVELAPVPTRALTVVQVPAESRPLIESAPEELTEESPPALNLIEPDEDWVEALIFSPKCIAFYRRRFAKGLSLAAAEKKLRGELTTAKKVRPVRGDAYLCLRVPKRFDAVLRESPTRGSADALYIDSLRLYVRRVRRRRAA